MPNSINGNHLRKGKFLLLVISIGFLLLPGCSKKATENGADKPTTSHDQANSGAQANTQVQTTPDARETEAKEDLNVPISKYTDVAGDPMWAVKWALANEPGYTDEDIMNALESGYQKESNAFKKRQMLESDLASLKEKVVKFKGIKYVKLSDRLDGGMPFAPSFYNAYDFSSKSFELSTDFCVDNNNFSMNTQSRNIMLVSSSWGKTLNPGICHLRVTNQALAEKIEGARTHGGGSGPGSLVFSSGTIYATVLGMDSGTIHLRANHVHYDLGLLKSYFASDGATPVASFDI